MPEGLEQMSDADFRNLIAYILNPPGTQARVHQHLNIGQGEVPWDDFFSTLAEIKFDGIMTSCVFAWEDKAANHAKVTSMLEEARPVAGSLIVLPEMFSNPRRRASATLARCSS